MKATELLWTWDVKNNTLGHLSFFLKVKFGEPMDQDSQELFGLVCQFVNDFKETYAEIR